MRELPRSLISIAVTGLLLVAAPSSMNGAFPIPPGEELRPVASLPNGEASCRFAIRARNTLSEDVWILFTESELRFPGFFDNWRPLEGIQDQRIAPGRLVDRRYEDKGRCGRKRTWRFVVRIGDRGGPVVHVGHVTEDESDHIIHLGESSCWGVAGDGKMVASHSLFGCSPADEEQDSGRDAAPDDEARTGGAESPTEPARSSRASLQGPWERRDSNYDPNDGMRIQVQGGSATLTSVPPGGHPNFQVGEILWQGLSDNGALRVLGSDGTYYPAKVALDGPNRLHIDVNHNGPGNDQTWERSGPSIDGEWVLQSGVTDGNEGVRVRVLGDRAEVRYVPPTASRDLRVGTMLWRDIGGDAPVFDLSIWNEPAYKAAGARLLAGERLRVVSNDRDVTQIWVRPGSEDGRGSPAGTDAALQTAIDSLAQNHLDVNLLPGLSVVVIQHGDVVYENGFGWADVSSQKEAHARTVYQTASVSKVIGATLAAKLEEEIDGFDLSDLTAEHLGPPAYLYVDGGSTPQEACVFDAVPWACVPFPESHTHTVEQLLAKTACIWHYPEGPEPEPRMYRWRAEALAQIYDNQLHDGLLTGCTPGSHYHYSTHGFTFVGAVLEKVTGTPMAELLREEIAEPYGLSSLRATFGDGVYFTGEPGPLPNEDRATLYRLLDHDSPPGPTMNPNLRGDFVNNSWKILGGGMEIHALDLARFGWKTLNGEIVSDPEGRLWTSRTGSATKWTDGDPAPAVGLAWNLGGTSDDRTAQHGGSWRGARSLLKIWRDRGLVVAIMSNRRDHDVHGIGTLANEIADAIDASTP